MQLRPIPGETMEEMIERYRKATIAAGMGDPGPGGLFGAAASEREEKPDMVANLPTDAKAPENPPADRKQPPTKG